MTKLLRKQVQDKTDNLLEIYQVLKKLQQKINLEDLKKEIENVWAVSFGLVAAIEEILDISQYVLAEKGMKIESYGKIPKALLEAKIIDEEFSRKMQKMIGFRNRAIHNYPSLDEAQLYEVLQKDIGDFKEFLELIKIKI